MITKATKFTQINLALWSSWLFDRRCRRPWSVLRRERRVEPLEAARGSCRSRRRSRGGSARALRRRIRDRRRCGVRAISRSTKGVASATPRMRGKTIVPADGTHSSSGCVARNASASALFVASSVRARSRRASRCSNATTASRSATIEPGAVHDVARAAHAMRDRVRGDHPSRPAGSTNRTTSSGCSS